MFSPGGGGCTSTAQCVRGGLASSGGQTTVTSTWTAGGVEVGADTPSQLS